MVTRLLSVAAVAASLFSGSAPAATVVGGSDLLTATFANQLETWLGEGAITLTNIFDKGAADNSATFHAAVDGRGRTFIVLEGTEHANTSIIGGYNPQSWHSFDSYNETPDDAQRTGFLFNLSATTSFQQRISTDTVCAGCGLYQTYNGLTYGPTFGGGHDLTIGPATGSLDAGYSYLYSYGRNLAQTTSIVDGSASDGTLDIAVGRFEVFTIAPSVAAIPEPSTYALMLAGLGFVGFVANRRRKAQTVAG